MFSPSYTAASAAIPKSLFSSACSPFLKFSLKRTRIIASYQSPPDDYVIVGCGGASMDYLVMVDGFPKPDQKIRGSSYKVQGGGNVGNALTCTARLGLKPRIICKVADDSEGRGMLEELKADGVDTSFVVASTRFTFWNIDATSGLLLSLFHLTNSLFYELPKGCKLSHRFWRKILFLSLQRGSYEYFLTVILFSFLLKGLRGLFVSVSEEGRSMFSYVIVDSRMKTRTAIYDPGYPPMIPSDLSPSTLISALDSASLVYFDGLSIKTALLVAAEASCRSIPILVDAEMGEEGFEDLLNMADYAVCSATYPQAWTKSPSMASALVSMLLRLPNLKFVIVTLGEDGCIMLQRSKNEDSETEAVIVDDCLESLKRRIDYNATNPTCVSSPILKLVADGTRTLTGRLFVGTAVKILPTELVDTTGAGDAFIGAVLYALCANMPAEVMLPFAAQVAAGCCRALGARTGLPYHTDPGLKPFLDRSFKMVPT